VSALRALILAALAAYPCACSRTSPNNPSGSPTEQPDRLTCYGYKGFETPAIDQLARDGVRFERIIAPAPDSGGGAPPPDRVDRATLERLRSLGYLSVSQRKTAPVDFAKLPGSQGQDRNLQFPL